MEDADKRMRYGVADTNQCWGWQIWWFSLGRTQVTVGETTYQTRFLRFGPLTCGLQLSWIRVI